MLFGPDEVDRSLIYSERCERLSQALAGLPYEQREVVGNNGTLQIKTVMDQLQWDVEFDPSEFRTVIPADL